MIQQIRKTAYSVILGALMVSFVFAACNSKKDKKDDAPTEDTTTKVEPAPMPDTTKMDTDTADTRPVKPGE